ncbi:MAG: hypothetical protein ACRDRJ_12750 [Streptosporangiaceae bacterium]
MPAIIRSYCAEENEEHFETRSFGWPAGYASVIDCGREIWLAGLRVRPGFRGRGRARALLRGRHAGRTVALSAQPFELPEPGRRCRGGVSRALLRGGRPGHAVPAGRGGGALCRPGTRSPAQTPVFEQRGHPARNIRNMVPTWHDRH